MSMEDSVLNLITENSDWTDLNLAVYAGVAVDKVRVILRDGIQRGELEAVEGQLLTTEGTVEFRQIRRNTDAEQ